MGRAPQDGQYIRFHAPLHIVHMAEAFSILPMLPPECSDVLKGIFYSSFRGLALRHRVGAAASSLRASLCRSLASDKDTSGYLPKVMSLAFSSMPVCPAPNFSTRGRDPKEQTTAVADLERTAACFYPLDLGVG